MKHFCLINVNASPISIYKNHMNFHMFLTLNILFLLTDCFEVKVLDYKWI